MEVFVILESFTDYKGGNATSWGVFKSKESAILAMPDLIAQRFGFDRKADFEEKYGFFDSGFINEEHTYWMWDRGDDLIEFYIQKDELFEPELSIKEQILKLCRENLNKGFDAGYGMYNFDLGIDFGKSFRKEEKYTGGAILQMYPIPDADCYGVVYLLAYYPLDKEETNFDHIDFDFDELTEEEQNQILREFKEFCEK